MGKRHKADPGQCKRILVADETAAGRALLREILKTDGHSVAEAEDTEQLLLLMRRFNPDLVILDLLMKEIDAYALAEPLRRIKLPEQLPLIELSPAVTQTFPERIAEAGFSAYLVKPISPIELRRCVLALLATMK
ncbi:MAG TPA: response regulator [Terriglobales bacterium]|nr:response regulator [Terriglobales bacterium]